MTETATTAEVVEWNPNNLERGTAVWVFEDSITSNTDLKARGFDVRVVQYGNKDSDGEIQLEDAAPLSYGIYARKWRLPAENLRPPVKVGDKVKVLAALAAAHDDYRANVVGKVVTVASIRGDFAVGVREITVNMPDGYTYDNGLTTGAISEWAIIETAEPAAETEATPATEPAVNDGVDWGAVIADLQTALNDFACDQEWCDEYEDVVKRLFGWTPERTVELDVTVRLDRTRYMSDLTSVYSVFGGSQYDGHDFDDDERLELSTRVTVTVTAKRGESPDVTRVREELDELDYMYDEFEIVDWETSEG